MVKQNLHTSARITGKSLPGPRTTLAILTWTQVTRAPNADSPAALERKNPPFSLCYSKSSYPQSPPPQGCSPEQIWCLKAGRVWIAPGAVRTAAMKRSPFPHAKQPDESDSGEGRHITFLLYSLTTLSLCLLQFPANCIVVSAPGKAS